MHNYHKYENAMRVALTFQAVLKQKALQNAIISWEICREHFSVVVFLTKSPRFRFSCKPGGSVRCECVCGVGQSRHPRVPGAVCQPWVLPCCQCPVLVSSRDAEGAGEVMSWVTPVCHKPGWSL